MSEVRPSEPMRILVFGAGVIGSVYAGKLLQAGHHVVLLARGRRLRDLRARGLVLEKVRICDAFPTRAERPRGHTERPAVPS
jgi:ketopantoate reductase